MICKNERKTMASIDEQIFKATKEIIVKFIEVGRLSPTSFHESFRDIYQTVESTVKKIDPGIPEDEQSPQKG
jgi:hypothetical protein